jgi:hypothetical protein
VGIHHADRLCIMPLHTGLLGLNENTWCQYYGLAFAATGFHAKQLTYCGHPKQSLS